MADELGTSDLLAGKPSQALQSGGVGSPAFQQADAFTLKHEGGFTRNDGIGHTANQGIDQNAHPGIDVSSLNPAQTQAIRHQYWTAVGGDELAQRDPRLALVAYETAIASGPSVANKFLAESSGDVNKLMGLRVNFMNDLVQKDPGKYGAVAQGWANRNRDLASAAGLDPSQFGLRGGAPRAQVVSAQPAQPSSPDLVAQMSNSFGALPNDDPAIRAQPAAAPAAAPQAAEPQRAAFAQLQPTQAQAPAAKSVTDHYLELLGKPKGQAA